MMEIDCYDDSGKEVNYLTQWSLNKTIFINLNITSPILYFSNDYINYAYTVLGTTVGNKIEVEIPNILLQDSVPISIGIGEYKNAIYTQNYYVNIPVREAEKPADYKYVDNTNTSLMSTESLNNMTATIQETLSFLGIE